MLDSTLTTLIAVLGTLGGTFLAQVLKERADRRREAAAEDAVRVEAVENWVNILRQWPRRSEYMASGLDQKMHKAVSRLSGTLRRGEGAVREFAVGMMHLIDAADPTDDRPWLQARTEEAIFAWVRGEMTPAELRTELQRHQV